MRIRTIAVALTLLVTPVLAADPPAAKAPTAEEKATQLDQIDQRINTMTARVNGILVSLHDSLMTQNAANLKATDDLAAANAALEVQKELVATLTKERDDLKARTPVISHSEAQPAKP